MSISFWEGGRRPQANTGKQAFLGKGGEKGRGKSGHGKSGNGNADARPLSFFEDGDEVAGVVKSVQDYGVFVTFGCVKDGLLAWSNVPSGRRQAWECGDRVAGLFILTVDRERLRVALGMLEVGTDGKFRPQHRKGNGKCESSSKGPRQGKGKSNGKFHGKSDDSEYHQSNVESGYSRQAPPRRAFEDAMVGEIVEGKVMKKIQDDFIIDFGCDREGIVPISLIDRCIGPMSVGDLIMELRVSGQFMGEGSRSGLSRVLLEPVDDVLDNQGDDQDEKLDDSQEEEEEKEEEEDEEELPPANQVEISGGADADEDDQFCRPGIQEKIAGISGCLLKAPPGLSLVAEGEEYFDNDEPEGEPQDEEDIRELLEFLDVGEKVEGTVTSVNTSGAYVDFGLPLKGLLPQRLIDWAVQPGDELHELIVSKVDVHNLKVALCLDSSDVDMEGVGVLGPRREAMGNIGGAGPGRGGTGHGGGGRGRGKGGNDEEDGDAKTIPSQLSDPMGGVAKPLADAGCPEVAPLLQRIAAGQRSAARELAKAVAAAPHPLQSCAIALAALKVLMRQSSCAAASLLGFQELSDKLGRTAEPLMVRVLPAILEKYGDRQRSVQVAAGDAAETIVSRLNPYGIDAVLPALLSVLRQKERTEVKAGALRMLALMRDEDSVRPLARKLDVIIPFVADMLLDVKQDVRDAALDAAQVLFECCGNNDLNDYLDDIVVALTDMDVIPACVDRLSETVFVQTVETQALAVVMPLILRGLKDRDELVKRRSLVIADNMCKLVPDVTEIQPFLARLLPLVRKLKDSISDPEVRSVADRCYTTLDQANKADRKKQISKNAVIKMIRDKLPAHRQEAVHDMMIDYVAHLCCSLSACRVFHYPEWWQCVTAYLCPHVLTKEECEDMVPMLLENCYDAAEGGDVEDAEEEGEDLCNCVFTLGYGALTLLNNTRLHLKRGKCYGLCGLNDCGKTTLLRAINNEQVDGFPPKSELVTAFVEHGIGEKEPECDWTPVEYMFADETIQAMQIPKRKVLAALRSLGFAERMLKNSIGQLSGGWKMKLGLVRAMLMCADILLLDEPTGHLDEANVAWLGEYVISLANDEARPVTTIVVSHDTAFLDKVCTHIINVKQRKLKTYVGSITDFVRRVPDAKSYITLDGDKKMFILPEPGMLEGVKSRGKKLLKMNNVTFTYPGNDEPTLFNVSIEVSMLSRVAVIGPNGSGKSTMIKALVGELGTSTGRVWKHPNVRIAYVAQHTFHHIETHLDKTATQYYLGRFRGGEDNEALDHRAEEERLRKKQKYWLKEGHLAKCKNSDEEKKSVEPEALLNRRKSKHKGGSGVGDEKFEKYDYQVKWRFGSVDNAMWVDREKLVDMGSLRLVQREDERQAAAHGLIAQPLTQPNVEEHLIGFGLDPSFSSHQRLGSLSGGQKVKVVMGAATWLSPHILILDEPTNYLDRDSLGALGAGLKEFGGGVIIISHNREFADWVCDERWIMNAGHIKREGGLEKEDVSIEKEIGLDEYIDEFGNRSTFQRKREMTEKELRKYLKQKELKKKQGIEVSDSEDEDAWYEQLLEQAQTVGNEEIAAGGDRK